MMAKDSIDVMAYTSHMDVSDRDIFESLDLDFPGLEQVKAAYRSDRIGDAKQELMVYFRRRTEPRWFFDSRGDVTSPPDVEISRFIFGGSSETASEFIGGMMDRARLLLDNKFQGAVLFDLGRDFDRFPHYDALETERKGDRAKAVRVTSSRFTRMDFMSALAIAYHRTNDERYAVKFREWMEAFLDKYATTYPYAADPIEDRELYWFYFQKTPIRTNMCVSRSILNYINVLYTGLHSERVLPVDLSFRMLKFFWFLMAYHRCYDDRRYRSFNHHLYENGLVPFAIGVMFPEFPAFRPLREKGMEVIRQHVQHDFHPSGGYDEHSMHYTADTTISLMLTAAQALAVRNGIELYDEACLETLRRTFDFYAALVLPDQSFPDIGDNGGGHAVKFLEHGRDWFYHPGAAALLRLFEQGPGYSARPGDAGLPALRVHDPLAGYSCAHDGWSYDSNGFVMCVKQFTKECGHNHLDMLSLTLWSSGETLIGEPLAAELYKYVGNATGHDHYLRGTGSHSTVQVCSRSLSRTQLRMQDRNESQGVTVDAYAASGDSVWISAFHDAFAMHRHRRQLLFVPGAGSFVLDTVEGETEDHDPHLQRWQLERQVRVERLGRTAVLLAGNRGKLLCVWPDEPDVELRLWKYEEVMSIPDFHAYKSADELPWNLDVAFGGRTEPRSGSLPCIFLHGHAASREQLPIERYAAVLSQVRAEPASAAWKDADWLKELAADGAR